MISCLPEMAELSPEVLLSISSRQRCVKLLKELPVTTYNNNPKQTAAVLIPLCVVNGEVSLLYTLRSTQLKRNSGQVSFPGGKADKGEKIVDTALRETEEELGLSRDVIEVWAEMPPVQGQDKDMVITPIVGVIKNFDITKLTPSVNEVDAVFTVSVKNLCDPSNQGHLEFNKHPLPVFIYGEYKIWGITGFITHMFLTCFVERLITENADFLRKKYEMSELMPSKL